ncbi:MAG: hypothetical protein C5B51_30820 [Terriglobia bacterium]|nr:MAG: hypothetical protein C5B51_30820 [Terriglobia bacterium]
MFPLNDLVQFAEELRKRCIDATYEILYGPHGAMEGLEVGDDFFPLWELSLPENQAALEKFDFAIIKARRRPDWSLDPPRYVRGAGL